MDSENPFVIRYTTHARVGLVLLGLGLCANGLAVGMIATAPRAMTGFANIIVGMVFAAGGTVLSDIGALASCGSSRRWRGGGERRVARLCLLGVTVGPVVVGIAFANA